MAAQNTREGLTKDLNAYKATLGPEQARLWEELFPTLKNLARSRIGAVGLHGRESATELVTTLYPSLDRMLNNPSTHFENRRKFFAYVALSMQRQLVAQHQRRAAEELLDETVDVVAATASPALTLALQGAIERVREQHPRAIEAFLYRYYLGHSHAEILEIMSEEYRTTALIASDLTIARRALAKELSASE
jgi:DNA-directed RNA polymerase specialized sigma24 family protein